MSINYDVVYKDLIKLLGESAVSNDPVRRFAWSTDASYFRIVPEIVVHADNLEQAKHTLLPFALLAPVYRAKPLAMVYC